MKDTIERIDNKVIKLEKQDSDNCEKVSSESTSTGSHPVPTATEAALIDIFKCTLCNLVPDNIDKIKTCFMCPNKDCYIYLDTLPVDVSRVRKSRKF